MIQQEPPAAPTPSAPRKPRARIRPLEWFITRALLVGLAVWFLILIYEAKAVRWPIRILIGGLGIWATVALVRDILWLTKHGGTLLCQWWKRICDTLANGPGSVAWRGWELLCAVALIAVAGVHLALVAHSMATTSLREDEIGSIHQYSSQGPFTVATEYRLAKNHIFYNLVNSLTPWSGSFDPLRARLWSFVAVGIWFAAALTWFGRRERYIEGAVVFALGALNLELLETLLESRGYGFIATFAGLSSIFAINYLRNREERWLVFISLLTVLGTWTLPFYIVFGGVVHLGLWLCRRDRATLLSGIFAGLGVLLTYAPVMKDLLKVTDEYDDKYGFRFSGFEALSISLQYLFPETIYRVEFLHAVIFLAALALIPVLARRSARPEARGGFIAFAAIVGFYAFCLKLETPPMRVTSFLGFPMALVLGLWVGMGFWGRWERPIRLLLAPALAALGIWVGLQLIREYQYIPRQKWQDAGRVIVQLLPAEAKVWVNGHYSEMMSCSFSEGQNRLAKRNDEKLAQPINTGAVRRGKWILFDALFKHADQPKRVSRADVPPDTRYVTLPLRVNYHRIWFNLPSAEPTQRGVGDLRVNGQPQALASATPQAYDPVTLARTAGLGDALYVQDDTLPDGQPTADAITEWAKQETDGAATTTPTRSLTAEFTVPIRDSDLGEKDRLVPNAHYIGVLLSQSTELKRVTATWKAADGSAHSLGQSKIQRVGELVVIELPKRPLLDQKISTVEVNILPEPEVDLQELRYIPFLMRPGTAVEPVKRPPLEILEVWRGAMPLTKE